VSATLQVGKVVLFREPPAAGPKLEVEWSSRWQEFVTSIKPALARSGNRLAGEAPFGLIPLRIVVPSYFVEAFVIFAALAVQIKVAELRPHVVPRISPHEVIYYSGDELPRTEDLGGAEAGHTGRAGGDEAFHRTQTIKIARGAKLSPKVVDAPNLKLPSSTDAVANLLAVHPDPGPPPAEGLRSARSSMRLATTIVAPAPNAIRDFTRNGVQLDSVIAPAPTVTRDRNLTAPTLSPTLIAPAPTVANDHVLVAPALVPNVVPPAPKVARDHSLTAPSLNAQVVAPAPNVSSDHARSAPALSTSVIPPASTTAVQRDPFRSPVQMTSTAVVPPPVSAPEHSNSRNAKLSLPPPSVVAPPPSAELSHDVRRLATGTPDAGHNVVPPPPSQPASGSFMGSLIGRIFGATEVVPPPPSVNANRPAGTSPSLDNNVVPPPPATGTPHSARNGSGTTLDTNIVAPPPSVGAPRGTGSNSRWTEPNMGSPNVVPPPPALSGQGGGNGNMPGGKGVQGGTLLANNVVPPPPSVGGGASQSGSGLGRKGAGLGEPAEAGVVAPPKSGGSSPDAGAVVSTQPGAKVAIPTNAGTGSLAMSPSGGEKTGLSGAGGGSGIAHGNGSGSGMTGSGSGAAKTGTGHGSDPNARGGISTANGPGGAGNVPAGSPPVRGVDISGGSSIITLPGFGDDAAANDPNGSSQKRTSLKPKQELNVTIVATASSGGAFEPYKKLLHGEKYTTYINTSLGTVVMEFADSTAGHSFQGAITAPAALLTNLPQDTPQGHMVVIGTLDISGNLKAIRVLEPGSAQMTAKVVAALRTWKFQPAMRSDQPVEVTAILGFGINTDDRF
jgi:hypothetical protein